MHPYLCFLTDDLQESAFILQAENNEQEGNNELERRSVETARGESFSSSIARIEPWRQEGPASGRAGKHSSFANKLLKLLAAVCLCPL